MKNICIIILLYIVGTVFCFSQKRIYDSDLDSCWSSGVYIVQSDYTGNWLLMNEIFSEKGNQYLLKDLRTSKIKSLGWIFHYSFSSDDKWFGYVSANKELILIDLLDENKIQIPDISSFEFSRDSNFLAALKEDNNGQSKSIILNISNGIQYEFENVVEQHWNPKKNEILIITQDNILIFSINGGNVNSYTFFGNNNNNNSKYLSGKWSESGESFAYIEKIGEESILHFHCIPDKKNANWNNAIHKRLTGYIVKDKFLKISSNDDKLFFYTEPNLQVKKEKSTMQMWDTNSPLIYPKSLYNNQLVRYNKLNYWNIYEGKVYNLTNDKYSSIRFNPNNENVYLFNELSYEPQFKQGQNINLDYKNLNSNRIQKVVDNLYNYYGFWSVSPNSRYVTYFYQNNWWIYDSLNNTSKNLTSGLNVEFYNPSDIAIYDKQPYGHPGWYGQEEYIILYDEFDIWFISPNGEKKLKITNGRSSQTVYRIDLNARRNHEEFIKSMEYQVAFSFDTDIPMILKYNNTKEKGYAIFKNGIIDKLVAFKLNVTDGLLSHNYKTFFFKTYNFYSPPKIYYYSLEDKTCHLLYESNPEFKMYDFGQYKTFKTDVSTLGELKATLLYPAQYDSHKKYPMITWVYERKSDYIENYSPPSQYNEAGFNVLNYLLNGYFVLLPDIHYEIGTPGISALNCVTEIVRKSFTIEQSIDEKNVGIIGHSFGGYETAFIATQTDLFKTAVAGAAVTDLVSWSHDISWQWKKDQFWRLENHQFRIGKSYYEAKDEYIKNSPFHHIENLKVPLLLWTGKEDYNINWTQSLYMYMAMRRLKKEGKLLLFEHEGHSLSEPTNQRALTEFIFQWFEKYLKGKE